MTTRSVSVKTTVIPLAALLVLAACEQKKATVQQSVDDNAAGVFQTTCATCHGEQGQGSKETMAPAIAALPRWYLEEQVGKFRNGQRGAHPEDTHGQQMRATVSVLTTEQIAEALDTVETLPFPRHAATLAGDAGKGAVLYREHCMECHRFNGRGEVAFRSSPVVGLQDWYLLEQWNKFKHGVRGYHEADESGPKMHKVTGYLANEREILDIIRYITTLSDH